jgi:hypothetical protein
MDTGTDRRPHSGTDDEATQKQTEKRTKQLPWQIESGTRRVIARAVAWCFVVLALFLSGLGCTSDDRARSGNGVVHQNFELPPSGPAGAVATVSEGDDDEANRECAATDSATMTAP